MNAPSPVICMEYLEYSMPTKSKVHYALLNEWYLRGELLTHATEKYYLLYWKPEYFFEQLQDGVIEHQGTKYVVVYKDCSQLALRNCVQVMLSFRKPYEEYGLDAIVMVRKTDRKEKT